MQVQLSRLLHTTEHPKIDTAKNRSTHPKFIVMTSPYAGKNAVMKMASQVL